MEMHRGNKRRAYNAFLYIKFTAKSTAKNVKTI
jgi:hypothetical protein